MLQASGEGEATTRKLTNNFMTMTAGTKHKGSFSHKYAVRKARQDNQTVFMPVQAINDDNCRVEWLTYKHINDWNDVVKQELIKLGVVLDKPGHISKSAAGHVVSHVFILLPLNTIHCPGFLSNETRWYT